MRQRCAALLLDTKYLRDRRWNEQGVVDRTELHQPHAVAVVLDHFGGQPQPEPGLSDAASANDSYQTITRQQALDLDQLAFTPNERCQHLGKIRIPAAAASALRSIAGDFGDGTNEPITPAWQSLDPMLAPRHLGERAADGGDLHRQVAFFNHEARPRRIHDARLGDVLAGMLEQCCQHGDPARAQSGGLARTSQRAGLRVEHEGA